MPDAHEQATRQTVPSRPRVTRNGSPDQVIVTHVYEPCRTGIAISGRMQIGNYSQKFKAGKL